MLGCRYHCTTTMASRVFVLSLLIALPVVAHSALVTVSAVRLCVQPARVLEVGR
jgi:hypothetical protein